MTHRAFHGLTWESLLLALGATCSCAPHAPPLPPGPPLQHRFEPALHVAFDMPAGWVSHATDGALILSGPAGTQAYYTTITLQRLPQQRDLEAALTEAYAAAATRPHFAWEARRPAIVAGRAAVSYAMHFELYETMRRKMGVLLDVGPTLLDVSYAATIPLFASGLPTFDQIEHSLTVYP